MRDRPWRLDRTPAGGSANSSTRADTASSKSPRRKTLAQGASVSHEYDKSPAAIDASHSDAHHDSEYERARRWRDATRELVLVGASVMAAAHPPQWRGS